MNVACLNTSGLYVTYKHSMFANVALATKGMASATKDSFASIVLNEYTSKL